MLRHLRRAHVGIGYLVAAAVIATAVLLVVASQALPWLARNPARVEAWLEDRTKRPVSFTAVQTHWTRHGPLVELEQLRIGEGEESLLLGDAELLASIYSGLLPGHAFSELRLRGLELRLVRADDGAWQVRGLPGQDSTGGGDPFAALERLGELHVVGGSLRVEARAYGIDTTIPRADLRLRVDGSRVRAGVRAWPAAGRAPLDLVADFDRHTNDGRVHAAARQVDLRDWADVLHGAGIRIDSGQGSIAAWADIEGGRVPSVIASADLDRVGVAGALLDGAQPRLGFDNVEVLGRWRMDGRHWQADLGRMRLRQGDSRQVLDGLAVSGGERFALAAREVDAAPLLQLLALTDRISPQVRRWLRTARPAGVMDSLDVTGQPGQGGLRVQAQLSEAGFERVGRSPGLQGLSGRLLADGEALAFDFDPASDVRFSWPQAFGADHVVQLAGRAVGWRDGAGWRIRTPGMRLDGEGYAADLRGGLHWQGDGSRPRIDLAAEVDEAHVPVARRFWVRNAMPRPVLDWLDAALVDGTLHDGRAIVSGDLDDWPFRDGEGRFEARARVAGAVVKFQPDWPAIERLDARLAFTGHGFTIDGRGSMGGVPVATVRATIDDYRGGALKVDATTRADAGELLRMLRASPLQRLQPETFAALSARGPAQVTFAFGLPLGRGLPSTVAGSVELQGARLADSRWDLDFDQVRGLARYDRNGFAAPSLAVQHRGQPGRLALRAGTGHVRDAANAFEAAIEAPFDVDQLLARAPEMDWLAPHVAGRSMWSIGVDVPRPRAGAATAPAASLQLRSTLVGTGLDLPAPLRKPGVAALPTMIEAPLPLGSGDVTVALGDVAGVRARTANGETGVRVVLGSSQVAEPAPLRGLVATGRAARLEALDWIAFARAGTRSPGSATAGGAGAGAAGDPGLELQRIDVTADRLLLLGGQFADARVQVQPGAGSGLAVKVAGPALVGDLAVPADDGSIRGRFQKVFWRTAGSMAGESSRDGRAALRVGGDFDPAGIPSLAIDVDDLRFGEARLGQARLRTRQTPSGMHLEQFSAGGRGQRLEANGEWTGRGGAARTRLAASVESEDFGTLLDGFGFAGRLGGGKGTARLDAAWLGAPAEFTPAALRGSLAIDARDGQLLEVEPGAGRVLGLLSLAELPRRLTLDFSDLFHKGFGFNRLRGTVRFADGLARSDDLGIRGPAAEIDIRGAANMRQQTFDQTIEVRPRSGNLLTAVGALAGGPVGAAIGAAANAVLKKPLGQIGAKTYRVTGPWAEPKVEVMTREQARTVAATAPAG